MRELTNTELNPSPDASIAVGPFNSLQVLQGRIAVHRRNCWAQPYKSCKRRLFGDPVDRSASLSLRRDCDAQIRAN